MAKDPPLTDAERDELVAYLDGELTGAEQQRVEERLSLDARTRTEADTLKRTWELLDYLPRSEPSPQFTTRTVDAISALRPSATGQWTMPAWASWAGIAAALVVAVSIGFLVPGKKLGPAPAALELEADPLYVQEPRVIDHLPLYLAADNLEYLLSLDNPDLFGEDWLGR